MIRKILLILVVLNFSDSKSQNYREEIISNFKKDTINYDFIANLSVIDTTISANDVEVFSNKIDAIINQLPDKESNDRREKKRIKKIYDILHDALFEKYEVIATFPEIFKNGTYNCVTASAVYAHVFDRLEIPYYIKEEPGHVFIIAYPDKYNIHLETTVPSQYGFSSLKESDIKNIVEDLIEMKLITVEELAQSDARSIYMEYFYGDSFEEKSALIGMQYYNRALELFEDDKYEEALGNVSVANIYMESGALDYLRKNLSFLVLDEQNYNDIK